MSSKVWDSLNEKTSNGSTFQMGIYVVQDGENFLLGKYHKAKGGFQPLETNYFKKNGQMLNRQNWYFIGSDDMVVTMNTSEDKLRKQFERIFVQVLTPYVIHISDAKLKEYGSVAHWGTDAINELLAIKKEIQQKTEGQLDDPNSAVNTVLETIQEDVKPSDLGSNSQVPREEKEIAKTMRDKVEHSAINNVRNFLNYLNPYLEEGINSEKFHALTKNDLNIYNQAAKYALALKRHGWGKDEQGTVDALDNFLNSRAELQVLATMNGSTSEKVKLMEEYFRQNPTVHKSKIPTSADFGLMAPGKNSLSYIVNQNISMDAMNQLIATGYKVVFNPNLLNFDGATRYAKQIKGTLAPVMDYDQDGMPDYYIYDKSGKIAVINGYRLKRDDKAVLKRMFYTKYNPKQRKAIGGFKGWLNTVLFQVGPYNWKGERSVRVTNQNWEMLQALHKMGYLKKSPESLLPKTKKSFNSTVKTHMLDAIKHGFKFAFSKCVKSAWYLPLNYVRDLLYKLIVGSYMFTLAEKHNAIQNLMSTIYHYNSEKGKEKRTANQIFKILSQWCSKDDEAKAELENYLEQILKHYIPTIHIVGLGFILQNTNYITFLNQTKITDEALYEEGQGGELRTYLNAQKEVWAVQVKQPGQKLLEDYFPRFNVAVFDSLVTEYRTLLQQLQVPIAENFEVNKQEYPQFALKGAKTNFADKYEKYNATEGPSMGFDDIRRNPIKRWEGATPFNADYIAGQNYEDYLDKYSKYDFKN